MQVEGKLLKELICDFCEKFLSYPPILINNHGDNMCGRCYTSENEDFVINEVYEGIAALVQFPCINNNTGCSATVTLENSKYHEENCPFRLKTDSNQKVELDCPLSKTHNCSWSGKKDEFEFHCRNTHLNSIIDGPYSHKPNLDKDSESYFILKKYDYLYLLQNKCLLSANQLWHNVQFLGPTNLAHLFVYNLKFKKGKSDITENNIIKPYEPSAKIESNGSCNKITNLINLLGPYDDINIELSIGMREVTCLSCNNIINTGPFIPTNEEGRYYCITCNEITSLMSMGDNLEVFDIDTSPSTSKREEVCPPIKTTEMAATLKSPIDPDDLDAILEALDKSKNDYTLSISYGPSHTSESASSTDSHFNDEFTCTNFQYGCRFSTYDEKLHDRHENWLCTLGTTCFMCFDEFHPDGRMAHLVSHHSDCKRFGMLNNQIAKIICKFALNQEDCQLAMTECHGRSFMAIFEFSKDINLFFVTTDPDPENDLFSIKFRIFDTQNDFSHYGELSKIENPNEQLYWLTNFPKFSDPHNKFNIVLTIKKWDRSEMQL